MSKPKMPIMVIVGILVLAAIAVSVFIFTRDSSQDSGDPATTNDQDQDGDNGDQNGDDQDQDGDNGDDQDQGDEMAEKVEKIKAKASGLKDSSQALEADFNTAVAAGCGDNLAGFNQNVVDLVTCLGEAQEALIALGGELETVDLANVSDEDQAIVTSDLSELEAAILASSG